MKTKPPGPVAQPGERTVRIRKAEGSIPFRSTSKKVSFVYRTKEAFLSDAFLEEHDAHSVCDAGFACDARLRRVVRTHLITYHSTAASLITFHK